MTYNIQHGLRHLKGGIDLGMVADVIREFDPDVVTLNEVRDSGDAPGYFHQTERIAKLLGWSNYYFARAITFPDGGDYGNAILSKIPFKSVQTILIPDPPVKDEDKYYETRCLIKAVFDDFTVLGMHVGLARAEAKNAVATVLSNTGNEPTVLMGDFNLTPETTPIQYIKQQLTDSKTITLNPPYGPDGTFNGFDFNSKLPDRIDYIFVNEKVTVLKYAVLSDSKENRYPSDHLPVFVRVKLK